MTQFKRISPQDAKTMIDAGEVTLADIRDEASYNNGHISGATLLNNSGIQTFIESTDLDQALIIYCYHGNSSQSAAQFMVEKGFEDVYSMDGGYEMWKGPVPTYPLTVFDGLRRSVKGTAWAFDQ